MTEEQYELRRINWREIFGFTHIFKSFKMAIQPSKLGLALGAIVLVFCLGWLMDRIWSMTGQYAMPGEVNKFVAMPRQYDQMKEGWKTSQLERAANLVKDAERQKYSLSDFRAKLNGLNAHLGYAFANEVGKANEGKQMPNRLTEDISKGKSVSQLLAESQDLFDDQLDRIDNMLKEAPSEAGKTLDKITDDKVRRRQKAELRDALKQIDARLTQHRLEYAAQVREIRGTGIFATLLAYEQQCLANALSSVRHGNFFGGFEAYRRMAEQHNIAAQAVSMDPPPILPPPTVENDRAGFVVWVLMAVHGLCWLVAEHWLYATIFLLLSLAVVAICGGAIHRIAALHFAREEKISVFQGLKFSTEKFLSFFTAPLIPLLIILVVGGLLAIGGLVASIPVAGEIIIGIMFFLSIILGLLIAFLLVGLVGGLPLIYPTIAVEGSDSFDAISRSFSYLFERPWRTGIYALVSVVHGTITYLFVRLFAFAALKATHTFTGMGVMGGGGAMDPQADKLDVMWNAPTFTRLWGPFNWEAMTGSEALGAWLIGLWVFLVAAGVLAYLLSYVACSTTVMYFLLRRKVDATDLDDVYVEEEQDELLELDMMEEPAEEPSSETEEPEES